MKKILSFIMLITCLSIFADRAEEILEKMENAGNYDTAKMTATMKIANNKNQVTEMKLNSYEIRGDEDKSLMWFIAPARLKNTKILTIEDNIWYYNKRSNRVRLLSQSAKKGSMMGSSFSYDDMNMEFRKKFTAKIDSEDKDFIYLTAFPKDKKSKYKYLKIKTRKSDYLTDWIEYYDKNDVKYKIMSMKDIVEIDQHFTALHIDMKEIGTGKTTYFLVDKESVEFNLELEGNLFSERNLKQ